MGKLISIIIPCYNVEKYIERCFRSIEKQTIGIEKLEVILVDDCSTDNTREKLKAIEASYPDSVILVCCEQNGRQGRARNIGLQYASAPYIGFVDSDDWLEPDMYEKMYRKLQELSCDIVMCQSFRDFDNPGQILPPKRTGEEGRLLRIDTLSKRKTFLVGAYMGFGVWNKLYRRELLQENDIFFPENLAYEDHFFATLLYFYTESVYLMEERLYHYFVNQESTVLAKNASYHFDILTVDVLLWEECEKRGFLRDYRLELEYQFLTLCYLPSIKMMILRLNEVPYEYFCALKEATLERVPDYHSNPYAKELVTELYTVFLGFLDCPVSREDLDSIFKAVRTGVEKGSLLL
ncbi:MAG: glycosyltransferase [Roseburia sp.]|nr:glycosyltransferase [Roseburia sp.]